MVNIIDNVAQETWNIINSGSYLVDGKEIKLPASNEEIRRVEVIDSDYVGVCRKSLSQFKVYDKTDIEVTSLDSFEAAKQANGKVLVHNFANAYHPGGGFTRGSYGQEESLCRESTLYVSLSSDEAKKHYDYNMQSAHSGGSDSMLISPKVVVFRDAMNNKIMDPFVTSVITYAAPNLDGNDYNLKGEQLRNIMLEKIRNLLSVAAKKEYDTLILGAWGCGAFCHDSKDIANDFRNVLIEEGYKKYFVKIIFAVYAPRGSSYNFKNFKEKFNV